MSGGAQAGQPAPLTAQAAADELLKLLGELCAAAAIVSTRADAQAKRAAFLVGWLEQAAGGGR